MHSIKVVAPVTGCLSNKTELHLLVEARPRADQGQARSCLSPRMPNAKRACDSVGRNGLIVLALFKIYFFDRPKPGWFPLHFFPFLFFPMSALFFCARPEPRARPSPAFLSEQSEKDRHWYTDSRSRGACRQQELRPKDACSLSFSMFPSKRGVAVWLAYRKGLWAAVSCPPVPACSEFTHSPGAISVPDPYQTVGAILHA